MFSVANEKEDFMLLKIKVIQQISCLYK